jgi:hypothetical protein
MSASSPEATAAIQLGTLKSSLVTKNKIVSSATLTTLGTTTPSADFGTKSRKKTLKSPSYSICIETWSLIN